MRFRGGRRPRRGGGRRLLPLLALLHFGRASAGTGTGGNAVCWGTDKHNILAIPADLPDVKSVQAGDSVVCAIVRADDTVRCWGRDSVAPIPSGLGATKQVTGLRDGACALSLTGVVRCFGGHYSNPTNFGASGGTVFESIAGGEYHLCALASTRTIYCTETTYWEHSAEGAGVVPANLATSMLLGSGRKFSCSVSTGGAGTCWGRNGNSPALSGDLTGATKLAGGTDHVCVLLPPNEVRCFGSASAFPSTIPPARDFLAGGASTCMLREEDGVTECYGGSSGVNAIPFGGTLTFPVLGTAVGWTVCAAMQTWITTTTTTTRSTSTLSSTSTSSTSTSASSTSSTGTSATTTSTSTSSSSSTSSASSTSSTSSTSTSLTSSSSSSTTLSSSTTSTGSSTSSTSSTRSSSSTTSASTSSSTTRTTSSSTSSSSTSSTSSTVSTSSSSSSSRSTSTSSSSSSSTSRSTSSSTSSSSTSSTSLTDSTSSSSSSSRSSSTSTSSSSTSRSSTSSTSSTSLSSTSSSSRSSTTTSRSTSTSSVSSSTSSSITSTATSSSSTSSTSRTSTSSTTSVTDVPTTSSTTVTKSTTLSSTVTSTLSTSSLTTSSLTTGSPTSTTITEISEEEKVEELLAAVEKIEATVLTSLAQSNETVSTLASPVSVTAAAKLSELLQQKMSEVRPPGTGNASSADPAPEEVPSVVVPVEGTKVEVAVPVTVFEDVFQDVGKTDPDEAVVMMVTVFNSTSFSSPSPSSSSASSSSTQDEEAPSRTVTAVISIDFVALLGNSSRTLEVEGLSTAIEFSMPTNYTPGMHCAFWDEYTGAWSQEGVSLSPKSAPGGLLHCLTTHLSIFAAIWQAFLVTLGCSQVSLLSAEAISNILKGDWYQYLGSIVIWGLMALFGLLYAFAGYLDSRDQWRTEFFLMPSKETPEERAALKELKADDLGFAPEATATETLRISLRGRLSVASTASTGGDFRAVASVTSVATAASATSSQGDSKQESSVNCITGCVAVVNYTMGNSAVREAINDIVTAWCKQLGIIQGVCENVWQIVNFGPASLSTATVSSAKLVVACRRALQSIALLSAQKQAAARMALSSDMVVHILEDQDIYALLSKFKDKQPTSRHDVYIEESGEAAWASLHHRVTEKVLDELDKQPKRSIFDMTFALFLANNPFTSVLIFDPFYDRKLRTFLFIVDQALTLMTMCFFFEASGERTKKKSMGGGCGDASHAALSEMSGYRIGRFMAIALVSAFISTFPILFLESLQTRGMVKVKHKGCKKWNRQLQVWLLQDRIIYGVGGVLFLFALFFINLFLANGSARDHQDWLFGISLVLLQDWLALPLSLALALPLTCKGIMGFLRCYAKIDLHTLVKEQRVALFQRTNAMLPLMGV